MVLISGEAGIGKSSLVATMRRQAAEEGYPRLTFRCSPYHTNSALYPVITHLEQMLGFDRGQTPETKLDTLTQMLQATELSLAESVPLLATLLSVPLGERYPTLTLSPQQQRQQTLDTLVDWMLEETERQPVLAIWEDLHWADPSTLEMLGLLLEQTPTVPMLHVLTFRPEFTSPWPTRSHMTPITLNRLERPQVEALIMHLAAGKTLPSEVVEHIVAKTDGVPLYVEELTKMLLESDLLLEDTDHYTLTGPLSDVAIPVTLQDSLMAHLDQMHIAKEVAQLGAVLGREFRYDSIRAVSQQNEETLQVGLTQLVEAELLYQRGRPPQARYMFKHALIQDAAYQSLLRSIRQQVHQKIAQLLEKRFPETVEMQPALVAHHYTEAGLYAQAIDYWYTAGQQASQRSAHAEAMGYLTKGLAVLEHLSDTPERTQDEFRLLTTLRIAMAALKGNANPELERVDTRLQTLYQQAGDAERLLPVLIGLVRFHTNRDELKTACGLGEQLLKIAHNPYDPARLALAHLTLGTTHLWLGALVTARDHLNQVLDLYEYHQTQPYASLYGADLRVLSLRYKTLVLWLLGYPDYALTSSHDAVTYTKRLPEHKALTRQNFTHALLFATRLHQLRRESAPLFERAEATLTHAQSDQTKAMLTVFQGWTLVEQGQGQQGVTQIHQGLDAYWATGARLLRVYGLALLAEAYGKIARVDEGLRVLSEARTGIHDEGARWWEAELYRLNGVLLLQQTTPDRTQAETCFHHALSIAQSQQAKSLELRAATSLARLWQSQGKRQDACDLLVPVYSWFTEGFDTVDLQEAKALLDTLV